MLKRLYILFILFLLLFSYTPLLINNDSIASAAWYNMSWGFRKQITIDKDQVPGALTNFPVCINLASDADLAARAQNDGDDILFTSSDEVTKLNHEIEYFNGGTGQLAAWVNVTSLAAAADTVIYMYYGNSGCGDQSNNQNTWDTNYMAVLHMDDASGFLNDSTKYGINFKQNGAPAGYHATGKIGYGVDGDGINDYFNNGTMDVTGWDEATIEAWYNPQIAFSSNRVDFMIGSRWSVSPQDVRFNFRHGATGSGDSGYQAIWDDTVEEGGTDQSYDYETVFHYYASTIDADSFVYGYRDSVKTITDNSVNFDFSSMDNYHCIGRRIITSGYFAGVLDEIRFSDIARSDNWLTTTYNTINNASSGGFFTLGGEVSNGNVEAPTGFLATTLSSGNIYLNWTKGLNSTHTRLEFNTVSTWTRGQGTLLYNDTEDLDYTHTSLSCNIRYYYQAWAYNSTSNNFSDYSAANNISCPGDPSNIVTVAYEDRLNISWVNNSLSWTTVLVRKSGSYPGSVTDGTILFNNTNLTYEDVGVIYGTHFYKLFTYNKTINRYSTGVQVPIGSLRINVYDINTSLPIGNWSIFISNAAGTQVYESIRNNNTLIIDTANLPLGDVTITINASEWDGTPNIVYPPRIFQLTLQANTGYVLNAYLIENGSTDNYFFIIVGPENEYGYEPPIEDATIYFKRYVNSTLGWVNVSIRKTSASGIVSADLVANEQYHITILKTGYQNYYDLFIPPVVDYEQDRYHTFRLLYEDVYQPVFYNFWDYITFTAEMVGAGYLQPGNITVSYGDSGTGTTNTNTYLYEVYNGTSVLKDSYYNTNNYFNRTIPNINTTRYHYIVLYFNNSLSFIIDPPVMLPIYSVYTFIRTAPLDLDTRIKNVVGNPPIGITWYEVIGVVIPISLVCLLGVFNVGAGIVAGGLGISLIQGLYAGYGITVNMGMFALSPFIIVLGVLYIMAKKEGVSLL